MEGQQDTGSTQEFNLSDLLQEDEIIYGCDNSPANNAMGDSGRDQINLVDSVPHQTRAIISIFDAKGHASKVSAAFHTRLNRAGCYIRPAVITMVYLSRFDRVRVYRGAFPKLKEHGVDRLKVYSYAEIKDVWQFHRNHTRNVSLRGSYQVFTTGTSTHPPWLQAVGPHPFCSPQRAQEQEHSVPHSSEVVVSVTFSATGTPPCLFSAESV